MMANNRFNRGVLILLFTMLIFMGKAQDKAIHGVVTTFDSIPFVNADVMVNSTKEIYKTDSSGRFSVLCNSKDKLKVSANGFVNKSIKLKSDTKIAAVNLDLKQGEKGKALAIGYGHVLDEDKLNAVTQMTDDEVDFSIYANMYDLIRGKFAGVQIIRGEVVIRGIKGNSSTSAALVVVDGVPRNGSALNALSPVQVKSINIIKDGSSAVYGMKGANGVILIETKAAGRGL